MSEITNRRLREIAESWSQNCCPSMEPCDHALARALLAAEARVRELEHYIQYTEGCFCGPENSPCGGGWDGMCNSAPPFEEVT